MTDPATSSAASDRDPSALPASGGFVLVFLALIGLGILAPPRQALAGGIVLFAAMIAAIAAF